VLFLAGAGQLAAALVAEMVLRTSIVNTTTPTSSRVVTRQTA
jgi:hypothetical protein